MTPSSRGGGGTDDEPTAPWRHEVRTFAELFALSGLAIAQPLFDIIGRAPDHLIYRGLERIDIIGFALLVVMVPPTAAYVIGYLLGYVSPRARRIGHLVAVGIFAAIFVAVVLDTMLMRAASLLAAVALASAFVFLHQRTRGVRIWLGFLSPAPLAFLALFLLASPVAPLLRSEAGSLDVRVGNHESVVILVLDELPLATLLDADGDVDADLFPNFARLAEQSHWFRQATTISNTTVEAVPAMLTGNFADTDGSPTSVTYPNNLFTLVGRDLPVVSSEVITRLCPRSICEDGDVLELDRGGLNALLGDAVDVMWRRLAPNPPEHDPLSTQAENAVLVAGVDDPAAAEGAGDHWNGGKDAGVARFRSFISDLPERPEGLNFFHLLLPHRPHRTLPDGAAYNPPSPALGRFFDSWVSQVEPVTAAHQQYLLQLQWTDRLLGELIDRLEETDTWNDTNLILLADHGFGYEPGGPVRAMEPEIADDDTALAEILWVPFFVKTAGQTEGIVSDDPVRTIDLVPTVADLLDVRVPWKTEGRSALAGGSGDPDEAGMIRAVVADGPPDHEYRSVDRELGYRLLLERTTGVIAPPLPGISGTDRIYAVGPRPDLFGQPVPSGSEQLDVDIDPDSTANDLDPDRDPIPVVFRATTGAATGGQDVAVAVNGVVWGSATVYGSKEPEMVALLPPRAFRAGDNDITVHPVD